jgi:hypothetical protein
MINVQLSVIVFCKKTFLNRKTTFHQTTKHQKRDIICSNPIQFIASNPYLNKFYIYQKYTLSILLYSIDN